MPVWFCALVSIEGVTASPNLATGALGAVRFLSNSALLSLSDINDGSTEGGEGSPFLCPSNMDHFSATLRREAVSVMGSDCGGCSGGRAAAGRACGVQNSADEVTGPLSSSSSDVATDTVQVRAGLLGGSEAGTLHQLERARSISNY